MYQKEFKLSIVTPENVFYEGLSTFIKLRTTEGEIAILKNHEPFTAVLDVSIAEIEIEGKRKFATICGGFIEVKHDKVRIITDAAEWPEDVDVERMNKSIERAQKRLKDEKFNHDRAKRALKRAKIRIKLIKILDKKG